MNPELSLSLRGEILRANDPGYEEARKIHNGMIDRRPAVIARCTCREDVIAAVRFARDRGSIVSVRGGGHGVAGFAVCDGGIMIDLSPMRAVAVDPATKAVRVEGGATWGDVDPETARFGLATTGGLARPTGVAGLTLGGGHGFLMRKYGLACDNLVSAELVDADGHIVAASREAHPDLFWAIRGGGGNFGIAINLEFRLHDIAPVLGGLLIYPLENAQAVFRTYRELTASAPDELGSLAVVGTMPNGAAVVVVMVCFCGDPSTGEQLLRPLRVCAPLVSDQVGPIAYSALQRIVENFNPRGLRNYWKSSFLADISGAAVETLVEGFSGAIGPFSHIVIEHLGGAVARVPAAATAVAHRHDLYNLNVVGMWSDQTHDEAAIAWVRGIWQRMQSFATGGIYVNYLGMDLEGRPDTIKAVYPPETYTELLRVKQKYDPGNFFRLNHNIRPEGGVSGTGDSRTMA